MIVGASLMVLWRARRARARAPGLGADRHGRAAVGLGDVYWTLVLAEDAVIPVPSVADAGYLAMYPLVSAGLACCSAPGCGRARALWVDGFTAALAVGSLSAAVVMQTVLDTLGGDALGVLTNLAYPIGDLILLGVVVAVWAVRGWQVDRTWGLLALGILAFWVADSNYLVAVANDTYSYPSAFDGGWTACIGALRAAAWQHPRRALAARTRGAIRLPRARARSRRSASPCSWSAALLHAEPVAVGARRRSRSPRCCSRLVVSLRENAAMLKASRAEALTDALTGLRNRRALMRDLESAWRRATPSLLALFDLDGFKAYNDAFGHPAGDALLARLGRKLAARSPAPRRRLPHGRRRVLRAARTRAPTDKPVAAPAAALRRQRRRLRGRALVRRGRRCPPSRRRRRGPAPRRPADVRAEEQRAHVGAPPEHRRPAARAGRARPRPRRPPQRRRRPGRGRRPRLGLDGRRRSRRSATPPSCTTSARSRSPTRSSTSPAPLDDDEWAFIRRHTLIGERIVAAAPALAHVAELVR